MHVWALALAHTVWHTDKPTALGALAHLRIYW